MTYFDECRLRIFYWKYSMAKAIDTLSHINDTLVDDLEKHLEDPSPCTRRFCLALHREHLVPYAKR